MGRQLYRSAKKFITETLSGLSANSETAFGTIVTNVSQDETEEQAVRKTLNVLAMQGHIIQTGEGDNATYRLAESGQTLLNTLGGA